MHHLSPRDPFNRLLALAGDVRVEMAAEARANQRWLREQAAEEATFLGVVADLAERGRPVALRLFDGRHCQGHVRVVGTDMIAVSGEYRYELLRGEAIVAVKPADGDELPVGDRGVRARLDFTSALFELVADRPDVVMQPFRGDALSGELRSVGADVARVRTASPDELVAVQLATIAVVGVVT